jgi:hypothetical protein
MTGEGPQAHSGQLFISWARFQRRNESMQPYFGYNLHYLPPLFEAGWAKPFSYLVQTLRTLRLIRRLRPQVLWVQMPPTFLAHLIVWTRPLVAQAEMRLVADCHNRTFRPPWSRLPGLVSMLNRFDSVVVHNEEIARTATEMGLDTKRLSVLETRPAQIDQAEVLCKEGAETSTDTVLVPCSFNADEPIDALLGAAARAPGLRFLVSGNLAKARARGVVDAAPENVVFTGFMSKADYERTLCEAAVILGLTEIEGIQLSVANEAVGAGKAMVLSDTAILRTLFGSAALFTKNEPEAIATACRRAVSDRAILDARSRELSSQREERWNRQAGQLAARLR